MTESIPQDFQIPPEPVQMVMSDLYLECWLIINKYMSLAMIIFVVGDRIYQSRQSEMRFISAMTSCHHCVHNPKVFKPSLDS